MIFLKGISCINIHNKYINRYRLHLIDLTDFPHVLQLVVGSVNLEL